VLIIAFGVGSLIANSVVLYATFLFAYLSNSGAVTISVNNFGEAPIEFLLIPISLVLGIYAIFSLFKSFKPASG